MKNKGITLIALIITIIVLLILSAVSIAILTGDNGVITRAMEARNVTQIAEVIERAKTDILGIQAQNSGNITKAQLQTILKKYFNNVPETLPENLSTLILITKDEYGKHEIEISKIYNGIAMEDNKPILLSARDIANSSDKSEYYGATVNGYTCPNSTGINAWKIFYADENNIYLIVDNYITYEYTPKGKGESSLNHASRSNQLYFTDILSDYSGSADIINPKIKALNSSYFNYLATNNETSTNNNMKAVAYMLDTNAWRIFAGNTAEYAIGCPTIELLFKSYNEKYGTEYQAQAINSTGYQISKDNGNTWVDFSGEMLPTKDILYTGGWYTGNLPNPYSQWLASPSAHSFDVILNVSMNNGGWIAVDSYNHTNLGLRPLVCLNSKIQLEKNLDGTYTIK